MKLDVLAFAAHPDDAELSCAGTLLVEKKNGKKTGVIDLTAGELGSRGSAEIRSKESAEAATILQLDVRENLGMSDGFFEHNKENLVKVIEKIRKYQPDIILCNAPEDRHPDHGKGAKLVEDAAFLSGLIKIETSIDGIPQQAWRPKYVLHYIQDRHLEPDFLVDISEEIEQKLQSIKAYKTQFFNAEMSGAGPETYISKPEFLDNIINNNRLLGKRIGVPFAEGFITRKKIGIKNFDALIQENT
jgi:bacillithiol biosynthesis deacetylase BshB1